MGEAKLLLFFRICKSSPTLSGCNSCKQKNDCSVRTVCVLQQCFLRVCCCRIRHLYSRAHSPQQKPHSNPSRPGFTLLLHLLFCISDPVCEALLVEWSKLLKSITIIRPAKKGDGKKRDGTGSITDRRKKNSPIRGLAVSGTTTVLITS